MQSQQNTPGPRLMRINLVKYATSARFDKKKYGSIIIYANLSNYICSVHYFSFSANICQNGRKMDKSMK